MVERLAPLFEYQCLPGGSAFCALPLDRDEAAIAASFDQRQQTNIIFNRSSSGSGKAAGASS